MEIILWFSSFVLSYSALHCLIFEFWTSLTFLALKKRKKTPTLPQKNQKLGPDIVSFLYIAGFSFLTLILDFLIYIHEWDWPVINFSIMGASDDVIKMKQVLSNELGPWQGDGFMPHGGAVSHRLPDGLSKQYPDMQWTDCWSSWWQCVPGQIGAVG